MADYSSPASIVQTTATQQRSISIALYAHTVSVFFVVPLSTGAVKHVSTAN